MKKYRVIYTGMAMAQLLKLQTYIQSKAGHLVASSYVAKIETYCQSLSTSPRRGKKRDETLAGLRIINYKKRVDIAFVVEEFDVVIVGIFYGGQDIDSILSGSDN